MSKAQAEDYIIYMAQHEGLDVALVLAVARSESGFVVDAQNDHSTASGLFQFVNGTFRDFCIDKYKLVEDMSQKNDPRIQIRCATTIMSSEPNGIKHWNASIKGWGHLLGRR